MQTLLAALQALQAKAMENDIYSFELEAKRRYDKGLRRFESFVSVTVFKKKPAPVKTIPGNCLYAHFSLYQDERTRAAAQAQVEAFITADNDPKNQ